MPVFSGCNQRRKAPAGFLIGISAVVQQQLYHVFRLKKGGYYQSRHSFSVFRVDICAFAQQQPDCLNMAFVGGNLKNVVITLGDKT